MFYTTETFFDLKELNKQNGVGGQNQLDAVSVLFNYLFSTDQSLIEQNEYILEFLQIHIEQNKINVIGSFLSETTALKDLHPSLLQSALIMTANVQQVQAQRQVLQNIFNQKLEDY